MGQFVRANSRPGRRGYAGDSWQDPSGLNHGDFTPSWQDPSGLNHGDFTPPWQDPSGLNHGDFTSHPVRRTVFPDAGSGNNQTINPFGGIGRVIGRGIRGLGHKLQGLRGWNPDGTPKTQLQWEEEREQRIAQKRINNILGRDAPATKATNTNLNRLYNTLGTPKTGRNLFTEGEINRGISPAMRQIYQVPDYKLMDGQGLEGTNEFNRLFTNEDEIRQMIENSNKTTSLPGNNDFNTNWANTRRAMTQVGLDKFRNNPVTGEPNFNRGVYDPYGIKTPSGAFSYDMNYQPDRTKPSYRTTSLPVDKSSSMMAEEYNKPITQRWSNKTGANLQEAGYIPKNLGVGFYGSDSIARGLHKKATTEGVGATEFGKYIEGAELGAHTDYANKLLNELKLSDKVKSLGDDYVRGLDIKGLGDSYDDQRKAVGTLLKDVKTKTEALKGTDKSWMLGPNADKRSAVHEFTSDYSQNKDRLNDLGITTKEEYKDFINRSIGIAQGGRVGYNTGGRVGILAAF